MKELYLGIDPQTAHSLLDQVKTMKSTKRGIDRHAFLIGDYAVLSTNRLKLRNVETRDEDLAYFHEIIETLAHLDRRGVSVVPILGYCYEPDSQDGKGYIFQRRARGAELYDDAVLTKFQVWAQANPDSVYLSASFSSDAAAEYLLTRTHEISQVPQVHFDKFIADMICILNKDILVDCNGKSNFFYDRKAGFQFIDLDAHNDYRYGLTERKPDIERIVSFSGFTPCHYAAETRVFASSALDGQAIRILGENGLRTLEENNRGIFEKCFAALKNNGIPEANLRESLTALRIFGC